MKFFKLIALLAVVALFTNCTSKASNNEAEKPNIIWIMAEDMSIDLECYGMPNVKTPVLNQMAAEGVRFDNCFVTNPICSPSRSAMLVGTHQVKTNAHNHRSNRDVPLTEGYFPFTYHLRNAGYTCILGHHGVMNKGRKIDANFKYENTGEWDGKTKFGVFDKLDTFEVADQPFFAQIQLVVTHRGPWWTEVREQSKHPVSVDDLEMPAHYADHPAIRLDWAKYLDQVEYMDNEVGMIYKELEDKGMADNTIIIFIGDNGRCNLRGKGYLHDPGLRIPLIVYAPEKYSKKIQGDKVRKDVISTTDITATILDWGGAELPDYLTGAPIFNEDFNREYSYGARDLWDEVEEKSRSITGERWKYIRNDKPEKPWDAGQAYLEFYRPAVLVMRDLKKQGKLNAAQSYFFADSKPVEELFDLENDPLEINNLANDPKYTSILEKMRKRTLEFDEEMTPVSDIYEPTIPISVAALDYVKKHKPEVYEEMKAGVEVGFKKYVGEYKQYVKAQKKKK